GRRSAAHALREDLVAPPREGARGRPDAALRGPPPHARRHRRRLRRAAPARPGAARAGAHFRGAGPLRADGHAPGGGDRGRAPPRLGGDAGAQQRRARHPPLRPGRAAPGHRPHHRAGDGLVAARPADGVRRQPHLDARRLGGARLRHRQHGGDARAGDADPVAAQAEDAPHRGGRGVGGGRDGQGFDPRRHRPHRRGRRHGPRHRICRRRGARAFHGRAAHPLQHVHRGGRPRRHGGAGRDDILVPGRPRVRAERGGVGPRAGPLARSAQRRGRRLRPRGVAGRGHGRADGDVGHQPGGRAAHHRRGARPGRGAGRRGPRGYGAHARLHGPPAGHRAGGGGGRSRVHRLLHQQPHRGPARRRPRGARAQGGGGRARLGGAGLRAGEAAGRGGGAARGVPRRRFRVAGARLLHVRRHQRRHRGARRARRLHVEPQLHGAAGAGGAHAPPQPGDGRGGGGDGAVDGRAALAGGRGV
ncbi:MAG: 3-isopropylmalate dehydratase large subunit, partial [uncultured Acetobacteraceae bacterium]